MSMPPDDIDQPTVTRRLSPRARTSLTADDSGEEPTVVLQRQLTSPAESHVADTSTQSLRNAALIVQQLDPAPEKTLVRAAAPLLLMVAQLRNSIERADVVALRREIVDEMDRFQQTAQKAGVEAGDIIAARYVLCAVIDETVLMTPWGSRSEWSSNSLLNQFHNETWGGEKVFLILDRILQGSVDKKLPLLILIHTCLMLGFEGRYRVLERGRDQLEDLRNDLSRTIRRHSRTHAEEPLSRNAKGERGGRKVGRFIPLWMVGIVGVCVLVIVYSYANFMLTGALQPAVAKIQALTSG